MKPMLDHFRSAFEAVPGAVVVVDESGLIVLANADLNELFGYEPGELIGQRIEVLVPRDVREGHPELREAYRTVPHRRTMGSGRDLFGVSKSGRLIPVEIGLNSVHSDEGSYSVASVLDVSPRIAEQERTRRAIDAAASAMIMTDRSGRVLLANSAACKMFGFEAAELLKLEIEELVPSRLRRRHRVYRTGYDTNPTVRTMGAGRDLFGLRRDGTEFPIEIGLTPIDNDGSRLVMATVIDITERVRAQREIQRQNEDLTRLNDELTQFAYSASHDLKAPLTTLQGLLSCVSEDAASGDLDEVISNATRAKELSQRLADLIESVLSLAQAENLSEQVEPVDIRQIVENTRRSLAAVFELQQVELTNDVPSGSRSMAQAARLRRIIENLISNAAKYADPAKPHRFVRVTAEMLDDGVRLQISDNGVGIPEDHHGEVFKRFRRFGSTEVEGSGVGLSLVKQHVDRMNGEISFESSPAGTTFVLLLPYATAEQHPQQTPDEHPTPPRIENLD